jgi:hypothetical protein
MWSGVGIALKNQYDAGMHKLNLDDTNQVQPMVDESPVTTHNVTSLETHIQKETMPRRSPKLVIALSIFAIAAGVATGYGGFKLQTKSGGQSINNSDIKQVAEGTVQKGDVFGVPDEKTFKDTAEGYLEAGGLDGEGSHKLLRAGGESQTVYLTSSITDLDKLVGMEVKIWGETFNGQKAGWLMDVGRIEVVNPQGEPPTEE